MEKINFNSLLKSSDNRYISFNILSAVKEKKKTPYADVDDYLIEYKLVFGNVNKKPEINDFTYHAFLSEFSHKEQTFIRKLIELKTKTINANSVVIAETTII